MQALATTLMKAGGVLPPLPLRIELPDAPPLQLGAEPRVTLRIHDAALLAADAPPTLDALADAYVEGRLDIEGPLPELIAAAAQLCAAIASPGGTVAGDRAPHARELDAAAVAYHYDLSNDFYRLWLDPELVYSCAYFASGAEDLAAAQLAKLRHVCRKLRLRPGQRLLDVGCGWGALARLAAREFGVEVLGITLSREQALLARERVRAEKLQDRVRIECMDYRDLPADERFDRIASIGMVEHVGHANLPLYCRQLQAALRPGGLLLNHGISASLTDPGRQKGSAGAAFIHRHVFPHGEVPHLSRVVAALSDAGLETLDVENLRPHYQRTLEAWSVALERHLPQARRLVTERHLRIWRVYLAGCAWAFAEGKVQLHQVLAGKPDARGRQEVPWSRADLYR